VQVATAGSFDCLLGAVAIQDFAVQLFVSRVVE
jgi:hypothetical protein